MARDNRIRMPSSGAGITQYFDEYKTKFEIRPEHVVAIGIILSLLIILLHIFGKNITG